MKMHEKQEFNGPLGKFLEETKQYRIPSIYNYEYRYIKEIIWDTEKQELYGSERAGYEKYKQDNLRTNVSFSCVHSLRTCTLDNEIQGYIVESKKSTNENFNELYNIYNKARTELYTILDVKDKESFDYYIDEHVITSEFNLSENSIISRIKTLEKLIKEYNEDEYFKKVLDKIKG